jgi:hypothetical protein
MTSWCRGFFLYIEGFFTLNLDVSVFGLIFFAFRFSLSISHICFHYRRTSFICRSKPMNMPSKLTNIFIG